MIQCESFVKRTVAYCQFNILRKGADIQNIDPLRQTLSILENMDESQKTHDFQQLEKSVTLISISPFDDGYFGLVFKSAKYGHVANLVNRHDGSERETNKTLDEGEKELTHMCIKFNSDSAIFSLESNKIGASASLITKYLQIYMNQLDESLKLQLSYLSSKGVADILENASRIMSVDVDCTFKDAHEDIIREFYGDDSRETYTLQLRPEKRKSLPLSKVKKLYNKVKEDDKYRRIRIAMRTKDGDDVILDSLLDKVRDRIDVQTDSNGVVVTNNVMLQLKERLCAFEIMLC